MDQLLVAFWDFAQEYYVKNGQPTGEQQALKYAMVPLTELYGRTAVAEFSPRSLKAVRERMIEQDLARTLINARVRRMAIARVRTRVEQGGHHVADEVVRRRYHRGLRNFFRIYRPVVDEWMMFDNSGNAAYELIAAQVQPDSVQVVNHALWKAIEEQYA